MSEARAATLRFLYIWMYARGVTKHKAEVAIKEIATYTDDEFVTFMNELTTLLSSEVPGAPKGKGLN